MADYELTTEEIEVARERAFEIFEVSDFFKLGEEHIPLGYEGVLRFDSTGCTFEIEEIDYEARLPEGFLEILESREAQARARAKAEQFTADPSPSRRKAVA